MILFCDQVAMKPERATNAMSRKVSKLVVTWQEVRTTEFHFSFSEVAALNIPLTGNNWDLEFEETNTSI